MTIKILNDKVAHNYKLSEKKKIDQNIISQLKKCWSNVKNSIKKLVIIQNNCKNKK